MESDQEMRKEQNLTVEQRDIGFLDGLKFAIANIPGQEEKIVYVDKVVYVPTPATCYVDPKKKKEPKIRYKTRVKYKVVYHQEKPKK